VPSQDYDGHGFYVYAMELFRKAGHVFTSEPEFFNHSPERFVYFDNKADISLSAGQRAELRNFNNVSRLFSANGCIFFSLNLLTGKGQRSQAAHDIHTMIHPITNANGTVCIFRYNEEILLSFLGYGFRCVLSDWYPMEDDYGCLLEKLDIANMSIEREIDYFKDMVFSLAREYYWMGQPLTYAILPIDFISSAGIDGIDREKLDEFISNELTKAQRIYGDDYVEYNEFAAVKQRNISAELDLMLLELDDDDLFDDDEMDSIDDDSDELFDSDGEDVEKDIYEFDDVDPEIFRDPTLMVKWLKRNE